MKILRTIILLSATLALSGAVHAAPSDDGAGRGNAVFEAAMSRGDALLANGDDAAAEREFRLALQQGPQGEARADALHKLGIALAQQQRFTEAEPLIGEAEKIARAARGRDSNMLADVLRAKTLVLYRTGRVEQARAAFREAKRIRERIANVWRNDADGTTWAHTPSGWRFPAETGPLKRLRRTMLDDTGHNIVVHYRIGPAGWDTTLVSIYVTADRGVQLAGEFEASKAEIIRKYPDAQMLAEGPRRMIVPDRTFNGFEAVLDLPPAADGRIRQTSFSAYRSERTLIRIRSSYPRTEAAERAPQIEALVKDVFARSIK